jgi:transcriptional regulator with XRE-family HTH domain
MDFALVVRKRLEELALDQRDLAKALDVTESYISQLLGRKKSPPLPNRTDLYDKMSRFLGLPRQELARLVALEHHEALDQKWHVAPTARFGPMRELVLRKCRPARQHLMRAEFEKQPFGELERLITRTLIEVAGSEARAHGRDDTRVRSTVRKGGDTYSEMGAAIDRLIDWWDYHSDDLTLEVKLSNGVTRKFGFREQAKDESSPQEPGFRAFLSDPKLSSGATAEEIKILRRIRFTAEGRPTALFYYRTLQNLRDPLHFRSARRPPSVERRRPRRRA